jgi:hypothetical protein
MSESFSSWLCFAELQYVDGLGELTGAPGAAAEFGEGLPGLELGVRLSPGARSFLYVLPLVVVMKLVLPASSSP